MQDHRCQRVSLVDRDRGEAGADRFLLKGQVKYDRRVGVKLPESTAHHRFARAGQGPRKADAWREVERAVWRLLLMVVPKSEVQGERACDAPFVFGEAVGTTIAGEDFVPPVTRRTDGDVELEREGGRIRGVVRSVPSE